MASRGAISCGSGPRARCCSRPGRAASWRVPAHRRRAARARSSSRCRPNGSSRSGRTPRCAGRRCKGRAISPRPSDSSSATTHRRRSSTPRPGACACSAAACATSGGSSSACVSCCAFHRAACPRSSSVPATAGASSPVSRARRSRAPQWKLGAIGVARWRGVPLREVLERAGITRRAVDVMPAGLDADRGRRRGDQGHVRRPLPVEKALDDALLAYEMNGAPLPPDHGFPLRLVVPGWVGIASIKWLGDDRGGRSAALLVLEHDPVPHGRAGLPARRAAATTQPVKSAFELAVPRHPAGGPPCHAARPLMVGERTRSGACRCASTAHRARVAGATAHLQGANRPRAWVRWAVRWPPTAAR